MISHEQLRDSESARFFGGAADHGYGKKIGTRILDTRMVRPRRKYPLSNARQGLEESMVQECLEIETNRHIIGQRIAQAFSEAD